MHSGYRQTSSVHEATYRSVKVYQFNIESGGCSVPGGKTFWRFLEKFLENLRVICILYITFRMMNPNETERDDQYLQVAEIAKKAMSTHHIGDKEIVSSAITEHLRVLQHETGDIGSNSILEILQLQFMMVIRYKIYMKVPDQSLFTIARCRCHHHVA